MFSSLALVSFCGPSESVLAGSVPPPPQSLPGVASGGPGKKKGVYVLWIDIKGGRWAGQDEAEKVTRFGSSLQAICYRAGSEARGSAMEDREERVD